MLSICNELSGTRWLQAGAPSILLSLRAGSLGSSPHSHLSYPPHVRPNTKSILAPQPPLPLTLAPKASIFPAFTSLQSTAPLQLVAGPEDLGLGKPVQTETRALVR